MVGRDGFLTCGDCGTILDDAATPSPGLSNVQQSYVLLGANSDRRPTSVAQECMDVYHYITGKGFTDPSYCVVPLTFILSIRPAEAASMLGIPEPLALYAVYSFLDGVPLRMPYGPKAFMPLRKLSLPRETSILKLRVHQNGALYVEFNGRIPLKALYAARLASRNPVLRETLNEVIAVRTRNGTVLCANVGCVPKDLPIRRRFLGILRGGALNR